MKRLYLIVGLGNPGTSYQDHRHNVGFQVIDFLCQEIEKKDKTQLFFKNKFHAQVTGWTETPDTEWLLVKPQTYMNLSGNSVTELIQFYKVPLEQLLVIHDDIDLPFGQLRIVFNRGHGGQNGVRHIHSMLGSGAYSRLRVGVGRPNGAMNVADWVLSPFTPEEQESLHRHSTTFFSIVQSWIQKGPEKTATWVNALNLLKT